MAKDDGKSSLNSTTKVKKKKNEKRTQCQDGFFSSSLFDYFSFVCQTRINTLGNYIKWAHEFSL